VVFILSGRWHMVPVSPRRAVGPFSGTIPGQEMSMTIAGTALRRTAASLLLGMAVAVAAVAPVDGVARGAAGAAGTGTGVGVGLQTSADVYLRDNLTDAGFEPSTGFFWDSPDLRVCLTPAPCATTPTLTVGSTVYVVATLRNPGPYGTGTGSGTLRLYSSTTGAAPWPGGWTPVNSLTLTVAPGVTTAVAAWSAIPGPATVSLLAVWESVGDPTPVISPAPQVTTQYSNNVAWKNVMVI
jgi:hypothetical protein